TGHRRHPSSPRFPYTTLFRSDELPAKQRAVLEAWRAGGSRWEDERARVQADPDLAQFLVDNLIVQMVRSFDRSELGSALRPESRSEEHTSELQSRSDLVCRLL